MRKEFEMSEEELAEILDACRPVPAIMLHCGGLSSPQENANRAWKRLGDRLGFEYMTVQPSSKGQRFFSAIAMATAAEQAKRDAEAAAQAERDRITAEQKAVEEVAAKREADKKHRAKIERDAINGLMLIGLSLDVSRLVLATIARGEVPNIKIIY